MSQLYNQGEKIATPLAQHLGCGEK